MAAHFLPVNLTEIAAQSIEILTPIAKERDVSISQERDGEMHVIKGNKGALAEVFNNLIGNAIKYNRPGGYVTVSIHSQELEVMIEIKDNGIGIEEEHLGRIFEEFYRVDGRKDAPVKGHGLGLSIAKKIVETHWGLIDLESEPGQGTIIRLRFPKLIQGDASPLHS
jgi:two-component system phosphate regulon sensor histidine kinase PhoR